MDIGPVARDCSRPGIEKRSFLCRCPRLQRENLVLSFYQRDKHWVNTSKLQPAFSNQEFFEQLVNGCT